MSFNYLGRLDATGARGAVRAGRGERGGGAGGPAPLGRMIEINASVVSWLEVASSRARAAPCGSRSAMDGGATSGRASPAGRAVRAGCARCRALPGRGCGLTPSDVPLAGLSQGELDGLGSTRPRSRTSIRSRRCRPASCSMRWRAGKGTGKGDGQGKAGTRGSHRPSTVSRLRQPDGVSVAGLDGPRLRRPGAGERAPCHPAHRLPLAGRAGLGSGRGAAGGVPAGSPGPRRSGRRGGLAGRTLGGRGRGGAQSPGAE